MRKVLLVEDDPFIADVYLTRLQEMGCDVDVASDGEIALGKIIKFKPEVLILDIVVPKVNGWEILKIINRDEKLKNLKKFILSNLNNQEDIQRGFKLGALKYFVKTEYTPKEVVEEIKKIIK